MTMQPPSQEPQPSKTAPGSPGPRTASALGLSRKRKSDFPELYGTAAANAKRNKKQYFRLLRWELIAVFVAALAQFLLHPFGQQIADLFQFRLGDIHFFMFDIGSATLTNAIAGSFVSAVFVVLAIVLAALRYYLRLDEKWRERRALGESVLVLVWRYSMRALPGDLPQATPGRPGGDEEYALAFKERSDAAKDMDLPPPDTSGPIITQPMRDLRAAAWTDQRTAYLRDRLDEQSTFYLNHARDFNQKRDRLRWLMIGCYIVGGLLLPFNGLGALTTAAGSFGSWLGANHYGDLLQSYSAMQRDLEISRAKMESLSPSDPVGASKWSALVDEIETKLAGEHQDWLRRIGE